MENNHQERKSQLQGDPFSKLMFGERKIKEETDLKEETSLENTIEKAIAKYLDGVNVDELFKTIDLFMTSTTQLKPLFNKVSPHIMKLIKKK
ncbi:hypothetical protein [Bacillus sp. 1NLA3E]|uniref:hypothetical protein n=1 Tax=Bacillus sp. 1NLA3E TaxID=666686 RepID=UPI000247E538|nr:hypothetical protein [Bacillus sp. 1NLA3E]AGK52724.1 hypothetical protein B1NLA3E_04750 [Bacillus sp. 1NLA3E]